MRTLTDPASLARHLVRWRRLRALRTPERLWSLAHRAANGEAADVATRKIVRWVSAVESPREAAPFVSAKTPFVARRLFAERARGTALNTRTIAGLLTGSEGLGTVLAANPALGAQHAASATALAASLMGRGPERPLTEAGCQEVRDFVGAVVERGGQLDRAFVERACAWVAREPTPRHPLPPPPQVLLHLLLDWGDLTTAQRQGLRAVSGESVEGALAWIAPLGPHEVAAVLVSDPRPAWVEALVQRPDLWAHHPIWCLLLERVLSAGVVDQMRRLMDEAEGEDFRRLFRAIAAKDQQSALAYGQSPRMRTASRMGSLTADDWAPFFTDPTVPDNIPGGRLWALMLMGEIASEMGFGGEPVVAGAQGRRA